VTVEQEFLDSPETELTETGPASEGAADSLEDKAQFVAEMRYLSGDQGLRMSEAEEIAADRGAEVVLIAGLFGAGKTTLAVELYARFLEGPVGDWKFAGSVTLKALDHRHKNARASSGLEVAATERTTDDDMRLLHLEVDNGARRVPILMSDVKGEFFDDLVHRGGARETIPLARRADRCVLVIDGARLKEESDRFQSLLDARLMVGALTEPGALRRGAPILITLTKSDSLNSTLLEEVRPEIHELASFASDRGLEPTILVTSARPENSALEPKGLQDLLEWLVEPRVRATVFVEAQNPTRFFWEGNNESD
jgi:hypothetical protein